jgi:glycosyltransferase involved in cell wall biosynthesis
MPSILGQSSYFDEYWAMSSFVAQGAKKIISKPIIVMPIPIDFYQPEKLYQRDYFGLKNNVFLFLFTYCADSTIGRKNPLAVINAFHCAFKMNNKEVGLVIKVKINQADKNNYLLQKNIEKICKKDRRITLIKENMDQDKVKSLYIASDCYVSLHRSEGFGITMAESMGFGKPTIATGYSGNMDFMTPENSCLVKYKMKSLSAKDYHGQEGQEWADPDIDDAAMYMHKIFNDEYFRKSIARQGMYDIHKKLSFQAVGKLYQETLQQIQKVND